MLVHPTRCGGEGAGKFLLGAKSPSLGPAQLPDPALQDTVTSLQRTKLLSVPHCPQRCVYPLAPVPICSKLVGFCPSPTPSPLPPPSPNPLPSILGRALLLQGKPGWKKEKKSVSSDVTSLHGDISEPGRVAQPRGRVPPSPAPSSPAVGGWLQLGASSVRWISSSWLHFQRFCGVKGGWRGLSGSVLCPPLCQGSSHRVGDSLH